jgi:hypothetical protein
MAKKLAIVFGIVFVLIGLLGFINNPIVGPQGFFVTDAIHNVVHLIIGIVLLVASRSGNRTSALWLKVFGIVYLVLFIDGLIEKDSLLGFITQNTNDTWLHLVLGIVLLAAGFLAKDENPMMSTAPSSATM